MIIHRTVLLFQLIRLAAYLILFIRDDFFHKQNPIQMINLMLNTAGRQSAAFHDQSGTIEFQRFQ